MITIDRSHHNQPILTRHLLREKSAKLSKATVQDCVQPKPLDLSVLLVEDSPFNQTVAKALLNKLGVNVSLAKNGVEALALLEATPDRERYQLIFMDCQMPEMDGYQATQCIRQGDAGEIWKDIPIIALTANALKGDREKCLAAGMDDYISKPVTLDALITSLDKWQQQLIDRYA